MVVQSNPLQGTTVVSNFEELNFTGSELHGSNKPVSWIKQDLITDKNKYYLLENVRLDDIFTPAL